MKWHKIKLDKVHFRHGVYLTSFLFNLQAALLAYVSSSFIGQFIPLNYLGMVYALAALLAIFILSQMSRLLRRFGNFRVLTFILAAAVLILTALANLKIALAVAALFAIYQAILSFSRVNFDIYLEELSVPQETGFVRGAYLTIINSSWVLAPLITGFIVASGNYSRAFLLSAAITVIALLVALLKLRKIPEVQYQRGPFWKTARATWQRPDILKIISARFLLQFFYAWAVIYLPIYLNQTIGFSWGEIGIMFTIMLLPFVIFEFPLGVLADRKYGEKEFLIAGFIILALSSLAFGLVESNNLWLWAGLLFASRVGASFVEAMTETYFFKKVSAEDTHTIEFFADTVPLSFLVAPLLASVFLANFQLQSLFILLTVIVASGLYFAATIKDTR